MIKSERERETRQKQKQLSQKMSEAEYMERKIRKGDKDKIENGMKRRKSGTKTVGINQEKEQR